MNYTDLTEKLTQLLSHVPARQLNGIHIADAAPDQVTCQISVQPFHMNTYGNLHGGYILYFADCVAGLAAFTDGRSYVTQSQSFSFIRGSSHETLFATGKVIHRGRSVVVVQVRITDLEETLLGEGLFNMFVINKPLFHE